MKNASEQIKILKFLHEAEKLKTLLRHSWLSSGRRESVAEHTWRLLLMAMVMGPYLNKNVRLEKVLKILVVHDLCEVYSGDTWAWKSKKHKEGKHDREKNGMKKLLKLLPQKQAREIYALWDEYGKAESLEAKFAKSLDKIEAKIQHNEGDLKHWNKKEKVFNLVHGEDWCRFDEFIHAFWRLSRDEGALKIKTNKHF
ncbi:MAG: HD domain-containing protein [Patescibacteria group bacterium]|nr:HD domain-containing protein [Patescibacteria group bacterium]